MKAKQFASILFITLAITLLLAPSTSKTSAVTPEYKEIPLSPNGQVHEVFRDKNGELWISEYFAGEIWRVNLTISSYTVYEGVKGASDGRLDSSGQLWWSNPDDGILGRLDPDTAQATLWTLPADSSPVGTAFDNGGNIWVTDQFKPMIHQFAPGSNELCTYPMPEGSGASDAILFDNGRFWLNDWAQGRILSLDPTTGAVSFWQLADGAYPLGLALDGNSHLWWADYVLGGLGRLDPQTNNVTTYAIPGATAFPIQTSIQDGKVWYSDQSGTVGALNPAKASGSSVTVPPSTTMVTATCQTLATGSAGTTTTRSGTAAWSDADYPIAQDSDGWRIYQLPAGAAPYGLATNRGNVWFADQGDDTELRRQFLGWLRLTGENIYLPFTAGN